MNTAHLHIMINHFPMIGLLISMAILVIAALRGSQQLARVGATLLVIVAVASIAVYLTGEPAEEVVEHLPGVSEEAIEAHEEAALFALIGLEVLGAIALLGLVAFRPPSQAPSWFLPVLLVAAIAVASWVGWTANLGGRVSHPEVRPGFERGLVPEAEEFEETGTGSERPAEE